MVRATQITKQQKNKFLYLMGEAKLNRKQLIEIGFQLGLNALQTKKHIERLVEQKTIARISNLLDTRRNYYVRR
jgi:predicted ArsR family transcriptional regulator